MFFLSLSFLLDCQLHEQWTVQLTFHLLKVSLEHDLKTC